MRGIRCFSGSWLVAWLVTVSAAAQAQQFFDLVPVKTSSGCEVRVHKQTQALASQGWRLDYEWEGRCVGGMAQGVGEMRTRMAKDSFQTTLTSTQAFNAGFPFGYGFPKPQSSTPGVPQSPPRVDFIHDGQAVSFTAGWGLGLGGLAVGGQAMPLPQPAAVETRPLQSIHTGSRSAMLMKSPCLIHKDKLPSCQKDEAQNREVFAIIEQTLGADPMESYRRRRQTYCPDPHDIASCAALVEKIGAPLRAEILAFLQRAKPDVDALLLKINPQRPAAAAASQGATP